MDLLATAFFLGLVGSLHCAVMCGPLMLAVAGAGARMPLQRSRLVYHAGRLTTYCAVGALFGAIGKTFALVGLQRWLSVTAGTVILISLAASNRGLATRFIAVAVARVKFSFARMLNTKTTAAQFSLGMLNGLLPCGLVYIAAASAAVTLSPWLAAVHMAAFGAGTLPVLLGINVASTKLRTLIRFPKLIPISVSAVAVLLLLRGLALGIPYLSPALHQGATCH